MFLSSTTANTKKNTLYFHQLYIPKKKMEVLVQFLGELTIIFDRVSASEMLYIRD